MGLEDLILYHRDGWPIAAVEVRQKLGTGTNWTAQLRRNILAHGGALPCLWKGAGTDPKALPPDFVADAGPILEPYFAAALVQPGEIDGRAFELLLGTWLSDLTRSDLVGGAGQSAPTVEWLDCSGLLESVRNGRVEYPVAA